MFVGGPHASFRTCSRTLTPSSHLTHGGQRERQPRTAMNPCLGRVARPALTRFPSGTSPPSGIAPVPRRRKRGWRREEEPPTMKNMGATMAVVMRGSPGATCAWKLAILTHRRAGERPMRRRRASFRNPLRAEVAGPEDGPIDRRRGASPEGRRACGRASSLRGLE